MSKFVRIEKGVVVEIIPEYALPVENWYGAEFASRCIEAPDMVDQDWAYDPETGLFSEPLPIVPEPSLTERMRALELENAELKETVDALLGTGGTV